MLLVVLAKDEDIQKHLVLLLYSVSQGKSVCLPGEPSIEFTQFFSQLLRHVEKSFSTRIFSFVWISIPPKRHVKEEK